MPNPLPDLIESALEDAESTYSSTTTQSYRAAWRDLLKWWTRSEDASTWALKLEGEGGLPLPPRALAGYLEDRGDMAWSTLAGRRQAIRLVYDHYDLVDPFEHQEVQKTWSEVWKQKREEESSPDADRDDFPPAEVIENGLDLLQDHFESHCGREDTDEKEAFRRSVQYLPQEVSSAENLSLAQQELIPRPAFGHKTMRNRALLLLVATTSATRTDIVSIRVEDIHLTDEDTALQSEMEGPPLQIGLRDDEGNLESVLYLRREPNLRYCPARAVASWIVRGDLTEGTLFRSLTPQGKPKGSGIQPQAINHAIRRRAKEAESLDSSEWTTRRLRSR